MKKGFMKLMMMFLVLAPFVFCFVPTASAMLQYYDLDHFDVEDGTGPPEYPEVPDPDNMDPTWRWADEFDDQNQYDHYSLNVGSPDKEDINTSDGGFWRLGIEDAAIDPFMPPDQQHPLIDMRSNMWLQAETGHVDVAIRWDPETMDMVGNERINLQLRTMGGNFISMDLMPNVGVPEPYSIMFMKNGTPIGNWNGDITGTLITMRFDIFYTGGNWRVEGFANTGTGGGFSLGVTGMPGNYATQAYSANLAVHFNPEPGSILLILMGLGGAVARKFKTVSREQ